MSSTAFERRDIPAEVADHGGYCLGDLLGDARLGLDLVSGGANALATPILGAHTIEFEGPARALDRGWMMLTTGGCLHRKPQEQRDLIGELADIGASCLGFGVGPKFRRVPAALLAEAQARNVPVVLVPEETRFRDVVQAVFQATQSREASTFTRLSSIQQNLLLALGDPDPLDSIVRRLGRLVHSEVALMSANGEIKVATGPLPAFAIAPQLARSRSAAIAETVVGEWHILAAPVGGAGTSPLWLVVASRGAAVAHDLSRAGLSITAPLVEASLRLSTTRLGQDRAMEASLLNSVLDSDCDSTRDRSLATRLSASGIGFGCETRTLVVAERRVGTGPSDRPEEIESWLHVKLEEMNAPHLASCRGDHVAVVVCGDSDLQAVCADLLERWPTATIGIGRSVEDLAGIRASYRDARFAVQHLAVQREGQVLRYDDLDLVTQLLVEVPTDRFEAKAAATMRLLDENPNQLEALIAYFANNRDIKAAAESIYLHPNTLRYRLERLEQALGRSLHEPSVTASLYCVLAMMARGSSE